MIKRKAGRTGSSTVSRTTSSRVLFEKTSTGKSTAKAASEASRILRDDRSSKSSKSVAASVLSQRASGSTRTVHSAPKKGSVTRSVARNSVAKVISSRKK